MPSFGIRLIALAAALACLAGASPARAANWFEMNFWLSGPRYDARLPACDNFWTLGEIQRRFATKEGRFWNSEPRDPGDREYPRNGFPALGARTPFRGASAAARAMVSDGVRSARSITRSARISASSARFSVSNGASSGSTATGPITRPARWPALRVPIRGLHFVLVLFSSLGIAFSLRNIGTGGVHVFPSCPVRRPSPHFFSPSTMPSPSRRRSQPQKHEPGHFDFYVLALSWSPSFCEAAHERNPDRVPQQQCGARPYHFVVHGLWPQYERGFPRDCEVPAPRLNRDIVSSMTRPDAEPAPRLQRMGPARHLLGTRSAGLFRRGAQGARRDQNPGAIRAM